MYYDFDCHFKQDQKNQSDMVDPVCIQKETIRLALVWRNNSLKKLQGFMIHS